MSANTAENRDHILVDTSGCQVFAPKEYTDSHKNVAKIVHLLLLDRIQGTARKTLYYTGKIILG